MLLAGMVLALTACSMEQAGHFSESKIQLVSGNYSQIYETASFDTSTAQAVGDEYRHYGEGAVDLVVTYDPSSGKNTAGRATNAAVRIAKDLRLNGVKDITTGIMPVSGHGAASAVEISFSTVKAQPPAGCTVMPGIEDRETFIAPDYKGGCTIDTLMARQIARPADLKGREGLDAANGRRQTNIVESYRAGVANSDLGGETTQ